MNVVNITIIMEDIVANGCYIVTIDTITYCAFLRRAKQKIGRVCKAKTTCHICDATHIAPCGSPTIINL